MPSGSRYNGKASLIINSDRQLANTIDDIEHDIFSLKQELGELSDSINYDKIQDYEATLSNVDNMTTIFYNRTTIDATALGITKDDIDGINTEMDILDINLSSSQISKLNGLLNKVLSIGSIPINTNNMNVTKPLELFALIHIIREKIGVI
jgi:hypothetical protein